MPRAEVGQPCETLYLSEEKGTVEAGWWSPNPTELQFSEGELEYLIDLLMGGSGAGEGRAEPFKKPAAPGWGWGWLGPPLVSVLANARAGSGIRGQPLHMTHYFHVLRSVP
jgi:hypothetical protein